MYAQPQVVHQQTVYHAPQPMVTVVRTGDDNRMFYVTGLICAAIGAFVTALVAVILPATASDNDDDWYGDHDVHDGGMVLGYIVACVVIASFGITGCACVCCARPAVLSQVARRSATGVAALVGLAMLIGLVVYLVRDIKRGVLTTFLVVHGIITLVFVALALVFSFLFRDASTTVVTMQQPLNPQPYPQPFAQPAQPVQGVPIQQLAPQDGACTVDVPPAKEQPTCE